VIPALLAQLGHIESGNTSPTYGDQLQPMV
jgi:hypothetical protein